MADLRKLSSSVSWNYEFKHSIAEVWDWITNTDRLNRSMGLSAIKYMETPNAEGGTIRHGQLKTGGFTLEWLEHPYEWEKDRYFRVERTYSSGPLKKIDNQWEFMALPGGCCRIEQRISFEASNWLYGRIFRYQLKHSFKKNFLQAYNQIENFLDKKSEAAFLPVQSDQVRHDPQLEARVLQKLSSAGVDRELSAKITQYLLSSQEPDLVRIRPFAVAREWQADRINVLTGFLKATRAGMVNLSWDLLCPSCRGAKARFDKLSDVTSDVHCSSCNIDFTVEFDRSIELSFSVHSTLRDIKVGEYCVGGPANTPHYVAQLRIAGGQKRSLELDLKPGVYQVRSHQSKRHYLLRVTEGEGSGSPSPEVQAWFSPDLSDRVEVDLSAGRELVQVQNGFDREITVIVERSKWIEDACTAAFAVSMQDFRDLFAKEALRPGQEIAIRGAALLFTDLKGSTALYQRVGDALAFALVQDHFKILVECVRRNEGAVVKTIGDAVMASFSKPENAVKAAIEIHRGIEEANASGRLKEALRLKIGIHTGPCFAVTLNDRMDYFGSTVNIAARTEGQCEGGDIVISSAMMNEEGVARVIEASLHTIEKFKASLKGLENEFELYRIRCVRK